MKTCLMILICVIGINLRLTIVAAQAPEIMKIDPPSWWVGSSLNPVRVMIRGRNLAGARVQVSGQRVGVPKISQSGTYIFEYLCRLTRTKNDHSHDLEGHSAGD